MQRRNFFSIFFIFLLICSILIIFGRTSFFAPVSSLVQAVFAPITAISYNLVSKATNILYSPKFKSLQEENSALVKKLVDQAKLQADNKALRDQFQVSNPKSQSLLEADIVGAPSFVPGFSTPQVLILDRGKNDGVKVGQAVLFKESLIGKVTKVSSFLSSVTLINNSNISFTAKTMETNAQGIVRGEGGENIILDEVLLSDNLKKGDIVLTKGDENLDGIGFPPNLIVGKIESVSKNASDLFQKAEIKSEVDFTKISKVFVLISP